MTAQEIRNLETDSDLEDRRGQFRNVFLREIAAQEAERNDLLRSSNEQMDKFFNRLNTLLDMAIQYAMNNMGMKIS